MTFSSSVLLGRAPSAVDDGIRIAIAKTTDELEALYRFRYSVYVTEMRRKQPNADHVRQRIEDSLDVHGHNLVAWRDDTVVGCARLNLARDGGLGSYARFYQLDDDALHPAHTAIVTRLMVAAELRHTRVSGALCTGVYELCLCEGIQHVYIDCNPPLRKFFAHLGFLPYIGEREHPDYGLVTPMRLDATDATHLAAVRSPFLTSLLAQRSVTDAASTSPQEKTSMTSAAPRETTSRIQAAFDAAMVDFEASPAIARLLAGNMTPRQFGAILEQIYHYAKEDPQIQALAAVYFRGTDRAMVRDFLRHAGAEVGHDEMALADMRALGIDSTDTPTRLPLPHTMALTAYPFYQIVYRNPIGYLGYLYFLEHMPTRAGARFASALLGAGIPQEALSFLAEHTTVDVSHNKLMERYIAALIRDEGDLGAMIYALRTTAVLYAAMLQGAIDAADSGAVESVDHCEAQRIPAIA